MRRRDLGRARTDLQAAPDFFFAALLAGGPDAERVRVAKRREVPGQAISERTAEVPRAPPVPSAPGHRRRCLGHPAECRSMKSTLVSQGVEDGDTMSAPSVKRMVP